MSMNPTENETLGLLITDLENINKEIKNKDIQARIEYIILKMDEVCC